MSQNLQKSPPVVVELKPDRNLLDPNFNGYKLSLETLPTYVVSIKTGVDRAQPSEQQYSLKHVKQFAVHNHIFSDPFNTFIVYIVDKSWTILRVSIDCMTGKLDIISEVWKVPKNTGKNNQGRFNVTLSFPDSEHAVISDGCDILYIVKTGDRKSSEPWIPAMTLSPFSGTSSPQFCLLDSLKYKVGNEVFIDVLAVRIDDKNDWTEILTNLGKLNSPNSFLTVLEWLTFHGEVAEDIRWILKSQRTLIGQSGLEYAHLDTDATGIILASDSRFHLVADTEKPINITALKSDPVSVNGNKPEYVWTQTSEEIKLWFKVPFSITKQDVVIDFKPNTVSITHKGSSVLEGTLTKPIKLEGSYWIIDTPKCLPEDVAELLVSRDSPNTSKYKVVEIVMEKDEVGSVWVDEVVQGDAKNGQQVSDPEFIADIHSRLAHLCSDKWGSDPGQSDAYDPRELEECDKYPADSSSLMRVDKGLQRITHVASLGSHQWLFHVRTEANQPPAICVRHDVDGVVWKPKLHQPKESSSTSNVIWGCDHVGTFSALGYVQASKQQRKYTLCSPNISYVAICDVKKHIYVYCQPAKIESCLRNRRTGEHVTHIAKQLVISLDPVQDILGAYATPSYLYVLTPENFHAIRILAEEE